FDARLGPRTFLVRASYGVDGQRRLLVPRVGPAPTGCPGLARGVVVRTVGSGRRGGGGVAAVRIVGARVGILRGPPAPATRFGGSRRQFGRVVVSSRRTGPRRVRRRGFGHARARPEQPARAARLGARLPAREVRPGQSPAWRLRSLRRTEVGRGVAPPGIGLRVGAGGGRGGYFGRQQPWGRQAGRGFGRAALAGPGGGLGRRRRVGPWLRAGQGGGGAGLVLLLRRGGIRARNLFGRSAGGLRRDRSGAERERGPGTGHRSLWAAGVLLPVGGRRGR